MGLDPVCSASRDSTTTNNAAKHTTQNGHIVLQRRLQDIRNDISAHAASAPAKFLPANC